jgi:hypothetical protein
VTGEDESRAPSFPETETREDALGGPTASCWVCERTILVQRLWVIRETRQEANTECAALKGTYALAERSAASDPRRP